MVQIVNPMDNAVELLHSFGFFSVLLPFLLVFAVVYGVLIKTKLFGEKEVASNVNAIIALATSFFVVASTDIVNSMLEIIPQAMFLLIAVMLLMMVYGLLGTDQTLFGEKKIFGEWGSKFAAFVVLIVFLLIIDSGSSSGIPIIRTLNQILLGADLNVFLTGEAFTTLAAIGLMVGVPLLVIKYLTDTKPTNPPTR